jgi:tRNA(Arg) A34 adenosine deaminase TadA
MYKAFTAIKKKLTKSTAINAQHSIPADILKKLLILQTDAHESGCNPVALVAVGRKGRLANEVSLASESLTNDQLKHSFYLLAKDLPELFSGDSSVTVYGTHVPCLFCKAALNAAGVTSVITGNVPEPSRRFVTTYYSLADSLSLDILDIALPKFEQLTKEAKAGGAAKCLGVAEKHEQVHVADGIGIDAGIVDLLRYLWAFDVQTIFSCQGQTGDLRSNGVIFFSDLNSFNIAWPLLVDLAFDAGLWEVASKVNWSHHKEVPGEWDAFFESSYEDDNYKMDLNIPRVFIHMPSGDMFALNAQAALKLAQSTLQLKTPIIYLPDLQ